MNQKAILEINNSLIQVDYPSAVIPGHASEHIKVNDYKINWSEHRNVYLVFSKTC